MWNKIKKAASNVVNAVKKVLAPRAPAPKPKAPVRPAPIPVPKVKYKQKAQYIGTQYAAQNKQIQAYNKNTNKLQKQADAQYYRDQAIRKKQADQARKDAEAERIRKSWNNRLKETTRGISKGLSAFTSRFGKKTGKTLSPAELHQAEVADKNAGFVQKFKNFFTGGQTQRARDNIRVNLERDADQAAKDAEMGQKQFESENKFYADRLKKLEKNGDIKGYNSLFKQYDNWYKTSEKTFKSWTADHFKKQEAQQNFYKKHTSDLGLIKKVQSTVGNNLNRAFGALDVPRRLINTTRNMIWKKRTATYYDGTKKTLDIKSPRQAWNASQDQNVINQHTTTKFDKADYQKRYPKWRFERDKAFYEKNKGQFRGKAPDYSSYDAYLKGRHASENESSAGLRKWGDLLADPLNVAGVGLGKKAISKVPFLNKAIKGVSKFSSLKTAKALKWGGKTKVGKAVKWLGKEAQTPKSVRRAEAIAEIRKKSAGVSRAYQQQLRKLAANSKKTANINYGVFDEIKKLSDAEARVLQRMNGGKLSKTDRLLFAGKSNRATRIKLEGIARDWKRNSDLMAMSDNIGKKNSRFFGKDKIYFADTRSFNKSGTIGDYNYLKKRKRGGVQSAQDLYTSQVDRLMASSHDMWAGRATKSNKALQERKIAKLQEGYHAKKAKLWEDLDKNTSLRMTKWDKTREAMGKYSPTSLWKKAVLKYNPAWHVNNAMWNTPASIAAGGKGTARTYGRIFKGMVKERTFTPEILKNLPDTVVKQGIIGKGAASKIESTARGAAYKTLIDKGFSHEAATKRVNDWLFDYSTKNYERPIKAILPFWQWNKGLAKLAVKMPFKYPRQAGKFGSVNRYLASQQAELPQDQEVKDPVTGETKTYSPRTNMKGKFRIPGTNHWRNLPFYPLDGDRVSINPALQAFSDFKTGKDTFGRDTTSNSWLEKLSKYIPQANVLNQQRKRIDMWANPTKYTKRWIAETGTTKQGQGYDKNAKNYMASLDPRNEANASLGSFLGIPRGTDFDPKVNKFKNNMYEFQKTFFAKDWDKIDDYEKRVKEQEALAKKYGFDMEFVYKYWERFDDKFASGQKAKKDEARKIETDYWKKYHSLPKGVKGKSLSQRAKFSQDRLTELLRSGKLSENRFIMKGKLRDMISNLPEDKAVRAQKEARVANGKARYARGMAKKADYDYAKRTGDWSKWRSKYGDTRSEKAKFWQGYWAEKDPEKRRALIKANPQYSKLKPENKAKIAEAKFWAKYASVPKAEKRELLKKNPKYNRRSDWTDKQWDDWKAKRNANELAQLKKIAPSDYKAFLSTNKELASGYMARRNRNKGVVKVKWS